MSPADFVNIALLAAVLVFALHGLFFLIESAIRRRTRKP